MVVTEDSGDSFKNNSLLFEEDGTYSEETAVTAVVCDRRARGGEPWRGLADVVEASAKESAGKLFRRVRKRGIVSTG